LTLIRQLGLALSLSPNLEIIGEAVRQKPEAYKASRPQMPWTQVE
jgi:uncharacterized protein with HEPN domain